MLNESERYRVTTRGLFFRIFVKKIVPISNNFQVFISCLGYQKFMTENHCSGMHAVTKDTKEDNSNFDIQCFGNFVTCHQMITIFFVFLFFFLHQSKVSGWAMQNFKIIILSSRQINTGSTLEAVT